MAESASVLGSCARRLIRGLVGSYYAPVRIAGREQLPAGPILFVANHQNSLFDPVLIGLAAQRPVRFLAKATLFDLPIFGGLLRALGMIPAYRAQDDQSQVRRNLEILDQAAELLAHGHSIGIFPEGKSHDLLHLEPVKSGTARIALKAVELARATGQAPVLVPIGLNFERKESFRTALWIRVGEPLDLAAFARERTGHEKQTQRALVREIETRLKRVIIHLDDPNAAPLLDKLEHLVPQPGPRVPSRLARLQLRKRIADAMNYFFAQDRPRAEAAVARITAHRDRLTAEGLVPGSPIMRFQRLRLLGRMIRDALLLTLGSIPALFGALHHAVPVLLTWLLARRHNQGPTTLALAYLGFGVPLLLGWYVLGWFLLRGWFSVRFAWCWTLLMPFCGVIALACLRKLRRGCRHWFAQTRLFFHSKKLAALRAGQHEVQEILAELADEFARVQPRETPLDPSLNWPVHQPANGARS